MTVYALGAWYVKPGREDDFVAAWDRLGRWTIENGFESAGTLLRDRSEPTRFLSFGPWRSAEDAESWRASAGFAERFAELEETIERFEPGLYDVVLRIS